MFYSYGGFATWFLLSLIFDKNIQHDKQDQANYENHEKYFPIKTFYAFALLI